MLRKRPLVCSECLNSLKTEFHEISFANSIIQSRDLQSESLFHQPMNSKGGQMQSSSINLINFREATNPQEPSENVEASAGCTVRSGLAKDSL